MTVLLIVGVILYLHGYIHAWYTRICIDKLYKYINKYTHIYKIIIWI